MACPVIIPLDQSLHFGPTQIGVQGQVFGKLFAEDIPVPATLIIPPETFYKLAQENQLFTEIAQLHRGKQASSSHQKQLHKEILKIVTRQKLPAWFTKELLQFYHRKLTDGFTAIIPANPVRQFEASAYAHIQGEANLLESLLHAWADLIYLEVEKQPLIRPIHLAPTPVLLQQQFQPVVSGLGFTAHPTTLSKTQVMLKAIWGAPDPHLLLEESDSFTVDVRTWKVIETQTATKTTQFKRESDKITNLPVPDKYQNMTTLTEEQTKAIAQIIFAIKQKRLMHHIVSWELSKEGIFITAIRENEAHGTTSTPQLKKTITKLFISTGNPQKHLPHLLPNIDGIGVFRSEYTLAKFGIHPLHVLKTKQKKQLITELVSAITAYQAVLHHKPILYRSQNFTSAELRQLRYSENYEPAEPNPYLGYRGGLQLVRQPQLLEFELEVLKSILEKTKAPIGFMPAFVRTPHELDFILNAVEKAGLTQHQNFSTWLQLNTPENVLNLRAYSTHKLAGISLNVTSIQALLLGIDPDNPEISEHYSSDTLVVERLLEQLAESVQELQPLRNFTQPLQLHLHLENYSHDLVAQAVKLGYHGVTVKPAAAQIAHATIVEIEEKQLAFLQ